MKNKQNYLKFTFFLILFFLLTVSVTCVAENIEINDKTGNTGDTITFNLSINNAPKDIRGLQFNIKYDTNVLTFKNAKNDKLASGFTTFEVIDKSPGVLEVIGIILNFGSDNPAAIPSGTSGDLAELTFSVNTCNDSNLEITNLVGEVADFSTKDGQFTCNEFVTTPTPSTTPNVISTPIPVTTSTPVPVTTPPPSDDGKAFTFKCRQLSLSDSLGSAEKMNLKLGSNEACTVTLTKLEPGVSVEVSTYIKAGLRSSIRVLPEKGVTNDKGELEFTISAISRGHDWIAWAVSNDKGEFEFSKHAYDAGTAWGMFVEVK